MPLKRRLPQYRLAPHVYACCTGKHVVFLDLKRDKYSGLDASDVVRLIPKVCDLPISNDRGPPSEPECQQSDTQLLQELLSQGIIVENSETPTVRNSPSYVPATRSLIEGYTDIKLDVRLKDIFKFLMTVANTRLLFRRHSLEYVVERTQRQARAATCYAFNTDHAQKILSTFNRLRPFLYSSHNACLINSLTVRGFLARHGFVPDLIFGVTTDPFKAHCWLQYNDIVINDTPEHVRDYTPILIV